MHRWPAKFKITLNSSIMAVEHLTSEVAIECSSPGNVSIKDKISCENISFRIIKKQVSKSK
jgi:hypothetical protein